MFTIENRKIIRGFKEHIAAGLGGAADYQANYEEIVSPVDGIVEQIYTGIQGGKWLWIKDYKGRSWQLAHLSEYRYKDPRIIKKGEVIAISGNTGSITSNPHLHLQVVSGGGGRLDPEIIIKEILQNMNYDNKIIQNQESGTPEAGELSLVKNGKRRRIKDARAGLASLDALKSKREVIGVNSKAYHAIIQGDDF